MKQAWYVELRKDVFHSQEVVAASQEEAEKIVRATLDYPQDWETIEVKPVTHRTYAA